jgi:hypothetical protein
MHAPLDSLSPTFTNSTCKGQAWWAASINFAGISWWHVKQVELGSMDMTQSMEHQVEGPIMQEKGVDESVWAVQLVEHEGRKVAEAK